MAQVQHATQLWQHIAAHPILAVLAGFTTGSAFYGALVHPTSPINIGRRLTAAEAHGPVPVEVDPLPLPPAEPEIPLFTKVDIPHATAYCAVQPVAPQLTLDSGYPLAPATYGSGHEICMLSGVLAAIVGIGIAFKSFVYLRRQDARKSFSHDETIAWLQSEVNKAKADIQSLNNQLRDAQASEQAANIAKHNAESALQGVQDNLQTSEAEKRSCQNSLRELHKELDQVKEDTRKTENKLLEVNKQLKIKENVCQQLGKHSDKLLHDVADLKASSKADQDAHIAALAELKAEANEANDRRMFQHADEKAALERERDNYITALTASKAEVSEANALRMSQEKEAAAKKAALEQERDSYIAALTASKSKDAALEASQCRVTDLTAEKAVFEQEKLALVQREQGLIAHKTDLEVRVHDWEAKCSAYEQEVKKYQEKSSAYRKENSSVIADLTSLLDKDDATISALEKDIADKNAAISSLKTQLAADLASARQACTQQDANISGLQSENERLASELESLNHEKERLTNDLASTQEACAQKDGDISSLESKNGRLSSELEHSRRAYTMQEKVLDKSRHSEKKKHDELGEAQHYVGQLEHEIVHLRASENNLEVELRDLRQEHAAELEKLKSEHDIATDAAVQAAVDAAVRREQEQAKSDHDKHAAELAALKSEHAIAIDAAVKATTDNEQKNAQSARENTASEHIAAMQAVKQKANLDVKELVQKHELAIEQTVSRLTTEKVDAVNQAQATITSLEKELEEANTRAMSLEKALDDLQALLDGLKDQKTATEDSLKDQFEQHQSSAKLELAAKDSEIAVITKKFDDLFAEIAEQAQRTQQLEVQLEQKTEELSSHLKSHAAEVQRIGNINEQQLIQIRSLNVRAEKDKTELQSLAHEKEELQNKLDSDATAAQAEVQRLEQSLDKAEVMVNDLLDEVQASRQEKRQAAMNLENQQTTTNLRTDRVKVPSGLRWSNATIKDDYQDVVRHGILQQGKYRSEDLVSLLLPHADPFYSELPHPIPQPCNASDGGETHSCGHCHETYGRRDYYNHGKMCGHFFTDYAVFCTHCESLFLSNGAFKKHEEVCGKARKSGIAPEVLAKQQPIDEFDVLGGNATQPTSTSSSFQGVAQKKSAALGSVPGDALVRAVLPFADRDYATCNLSGPVELDAVLPRGFVGDIFNQKFWCDNCKLWYQKSAKSAHLLACNSFFKGRDGHHPHAYCRFCGDIFRDNAGFAKHMELCKMNPTKDLCLFCRELFNVEGNELAEHTPDCYANPNRAHYDLPARRDRRERIAGTQNEATGAGANPMISTSSTPTGTAAERAAPEDAQVQRAPQDNGKVGPQAIATGHESTNNMLMAVSSPKTDRTSSTAAHTTTTAIAASTTAPTASQTPSPPTNIAAGSSEFNKVHIGTNRSPQPPVASTPSPSALFTTGNFSITPDSVLATPFVPKTASPTSNFPSSQSGLGMSRFSPGFVGSHPGPPMNAYNNSSPSQPSSNFQPRSFGSVGPQVYPPLFNSGVPTRTMNSSFSPHQNAGFPSNLQGATDLPPHMQHNTGFQRDVWNPTSFAPLDQNTFGFQPNIQGATGFPPRQSYNSGSAPSPSTRRAFRPINTTLGSANNRTYVCRHCNLRLPKAMMLKHNPRCQVWRHGPRNTPPPNSDVAIKPTNNAESTNSSSSNDAANPPNSDDASKPLTSDAISNPPNSDDAPNPPNSDEPANLSNSDDGIKP